MNLRLKQQESQTQLAKFEKREFNKQQEKLRRVMQKVEYQQNTISRKDPHGAKMLKKKMHSLKSQEKKLENMELTENPDVEESIYFTFENIEVPKTKNILQFRLLELKIADKTLCKNIELNVVGNMHVCIVGKNGVGKSTLIKLIYDQLKDRKDLKIGYMPQNYEDTFEKDKTVLDFLCPNGGKEEITKARLLLGNMKFTKGEMEGKISNLSNGNKAKLFLGKLTLDRCECLILDEPTRNVSPLSNPVIRKVLKEYKGTIISVSHDRKYIDEVIDHLYILTSSKLIKSNQKL